jgi:hypothetical protein
VGSNPTPSVNKVKPRKALEPYGVSCVVCRFERDAIDCDESVTRYAISSRDVEHCGHDARGSVLLIGELHRLCARPAARLCHVDVRQ